MSADCGCDYEAETGAYAACAEVHEKAAELCKCTPEDLLRHGHRGCDFMKWLREHDAV